MERQHTGALAQHTVDQVLQYRCATAADVTVAMSPLAVDDAYAAQSVAMGIGQKCTDQGLGCAGIGAVQVEFFLRRHFPAAQALPCRLTDLATPGERIFCFQQ